MNRRAPAAIAVGNCDGELAGAPHDEQKRTFSGTSAAQLGHRIMVADCIAGPRPTGVQQAVAGMTPPFDSPGGTISWHRPWAASSFPPGTPTFYNPRPEPVSKSCCDETACNKKNDLNHLLNVRILRKPLIQESGYC